jgi:DNA uptake protein ComE-like DNA-binding protein
MNIRYRLIFATLLMATFAGCARQPESSDELREKTARATAEAKRDAKAVAQGIREGWSRDKPLDLNTATKDQLETLPGMTAVEANQVIAGRPYNDPSDLVTRRILSKPQYDKISDRVTARKQW